MTFVKDYCNVVAVLELYNYNINIIFTVHG